MKIHTRNISSKNKASYEVCDVVTGSGMMVSFSPLGASVQKIAIISEDGEETLLALSFAGQDAAGDCIGYAGATLGPNAGRIRNSCISIDGRDYPLAANEGSCQLHGGPHNLSSVLWHTDFVEQDRDFVRITFSAFQPHGEDGYPGNRTYKAVYTLDDTGWLTVHYKAVTDRTTYINLSSHIYWNLTGDFTRNALDQELTLFSSNVGLLDEAHLPVNICPVGRTPFDFRKGRSLTQAMGARTGAMYREQLLREQGYNHPFLLKKARPRRPLPSVRQVPALQKACVLRDPASGRTMQMMTSAPVLVVYSGGFLPENRLLANGQRSTASCAIALEAQDFPDVMHMLPEAWRLTGAGEMFERVIRFHVI